ncbi:MAG: hypothetical protein WC788_01795 [Candidatus Paceibacterota bacterium]|jgi:hypothetical protein
MMKIGKKTDEELFKSFKKLFELYAREAGEGRYYLFLQDDVLAENISFASRKTAASAEEGLRELGKAIYFYATGTWEHNDPSIKIDGYPPIKIFFWPALEVLLSKAEAPSIGRIEEIFGSAQADTGARGSEAEISGKWSNIAQTKDLKGILINIGCTVLTLRQESKNPSKDIKAGDLIVIAPEGCKILALCKDDGVRIRIERPDRIFYEYLLKEFGYKIRNKYHGNEVHLRRIEAGHDRSAQRDAEKFIDEVINFAKAYARELKFDNVTGMILWASNREKNLIKMIPNDHAGVALFENGGFIDEKEAVEFKNITTVTGRAYYSIEGFAYGMNGLKEELKGKKVLSVLDRRGNWYLRVCEE